MTTRTRPRAGRSGSKEHDRARAEVAPLDPRVRDRAAAGRRAGRRHLRVVIAIGVLLVLLAVAWGVSISPLLDVDHVTVRGIDRVTAAQVEDAGGIRRGDAMAWLDTGRAVRGIEALPFVERATVTRAWPDTVRITVAERRPVAWLDGPGGKVVVDGTGRVLESVASPPQGMPQLAGTKLVPAPGATVAPVTGARVAAGLSGLVAGGTQSVTVTDAGVTLQLVSGPEIRLGDATQVGVKLRAALAVLGASEGIEVHYVDVSVPTNPVAG